MFRVDSAYRLVWVFLFAAVTAPVAYSAVPAESLLPATTKGYLSVPDVDQLREQWSETQLGHLVSDPAMKPFAEDLRNQLKRKLSRTGVRLGLTLEDLEGVYGGEVCVALIQPAGDPGQHAVAILVDITDHREAADALLEKIEKKLGERGATKTTRDVDKTKLTIYQLPKKKEETEAPGKAVFFIKDQQLVGIDNVELAEQMVARFSGEHTDTLGELPAFAAVMARCRQASEDLDPNVRWFVEPFGLMQVMRAAAGGRKKRGTDMLKVLANQGFQAIQGVGGYVNFATQEHELLHRTMAYAPPLDRGDDPSNKDRYDLAARMLNFPNTAMLVAEDWVPRELATYVSFNWKMKDAFEYSKTLVDEVAGDEGFFEDLLTSIATDPSGPQIDVRKELVDHLGERGTVLSDYVLPISPKSERMLFAIEVTDPEGVTKTINKAMESDPDAARRLEIDGHVVWEIISQQEEDIPQLQIDAPGFGPIPIEEEEEEEEERLMPNSAITVVHGRLMVATHVDFLAKIIGPAPDSDTLTESADYQLVNTYLEELGAGEDSFRVFSRTDEEYRPAYELIRQGKMPESETMLGRVLNRVLGPEEEGVLREQQIDGTTLPEYQIVRRYLGPGGMYVHSDDDGWFVCGALLTKHTESEGQQDEPALTTASAEKDPAEAEKE